jgi:hypothetical protein
VTVLIAGEFLIETLFHPVSDSSKNNFGKLMYDKKEKKMITGKKNNNNTNVKNKGKSITFVGSRWCEV